MPLKFDRVQAGEYQINDGPNMVGYIQKKNSAKWILYKCTNPALRGNPLSVSKTLKELKVEAEKIIGSTYVSPVKQNELKVDKSSRKVDNLSQEERTQIMQEMLNRNYVIDLKEYKQTEEGLVDVEELVTV